MVRSLTGVTHSVRDFVVAAFREVGVEDWQSLVRQDPGLLRPTDIVGRYGDASKAGRVLGWRPRTSFQELVRIMVAADRESERAARRRMASKGGRMESPTTGSATS